MANLLPKIIFDKITLTSDNSKALVVDDPHVQSSLEGTYKRGTNVFSMAVNLSAFDVGDELAESGWLSFLTEFQQYLSYIKVAFAITYKKSDADNFNSNIAKNDISLPYSIIVKSKKESEKLISKGTNRIRAYPGGISYGTFGFESLQKKELNLSSFLDANNNYKVPINFTVYDIPKNIEHLEIFAFPYLDVLDDKTLNLEVTQALAKLSETLETPYGYSFNVIKNSEVQKLEIINNSIITDDVVKLKLKLPKDNIIDKLNLTYNSNLKRNSISELYESKSEENQQTLFFFINKNKLKLDNSIFSNSFKNREQIPQSVLNVLSSSYFEIQLVKTEINENDEKITKSNKYLNVINYSLSTDVVNIDYKFNFIPNVFENIDLYYFTQQSKDEYNINTTYGLSINLFDSLVDKLREYNSVLLKNLSSLRDYYEFINKPVSSGGFYDLNTNSIKNIQVLQTMFSTINQNSSNKFYVPNPNTAKQPALLFSEQITKSFIDSLSYVKDLFNLNVDIPNLEIVIKNSLIPELTNLEGIQFVINLHENLIENLSPILNKIKNSQSKKANKNGVSNPNSGTGGKFFVTLEHQFVYKSKTTFYNDFKNNNLLLTIFQNLNFIIENSEYPKITSFSNVPTQAFYPQNVKLYNRELQIRSTTPALDSAYTDSAKFLFMFYNDLIKNSVSTESSFEFSKDLDDINYDSVSSVLASKFNIISTDILLDDSTAQQQIQNFSYKSLTKFDSNSGIEQVEEDSSFATDKSDLITRQLETRDNRLSPNNFNTFGVGAKKDIKQSLINKNLSQIADSVDYLIYNIALKNLNININQQTSVQLFLPLFKIQILKSFDSNILSAPVWEDLGQSTNLTGIKMARIIFTRPNDEYVRKALKNFEYPNKYFIIGTP
jgi:hypothetical protein